MHYFVVYKPDGSLLETMETPLTREQNQQFYQVEQVVEISKEQWERLRASGLEYWKHENGKLRELSATDKQLLNEFKKDWARHHTMAGLQEYVASMEQRMKQLEKGVVK